MQRMKLVTVAMILWMPIANLKAETVQDKTIRIQKDSIKKCTANVDKLLAALKRARAHSEKQQAFIRFQQEGVKKLEARIKELEAGK